MKLENQVCNVQQSEELIKRGVTESTQYYWLYDNSNTWKIIPVELREFFSKGEKCLPAFTVAELGVMLPTGYNTMRVTEIDWTTEQWHGYDLDDKDFPNEKGYKTEAECRAEMLIALLKSGEVTPESVNERLIKI